jgi:hypothetical protein
MPALNESSDFVLRSLFDVHVLELAGLEYLAAFLAFYELRLLVPAYDLYARVLARRLYITAWSRCRRLGGHKSGSSPNNEERRGDVFAGISRYFRPALGVVKPSVLSCRKFVTRFLDRPPIPLELPDPRNPTKIIAYP